MPISFEHIPLVAYLRQKDAVFYGKILELRDAVRRWLSYIPQTFPHYTSHTIEHSEEIVLQASKLLFETERPDTCVLPLSGVEAYIIIAAAYLHDAGMVASEAEKQQILDSDDWREWTGGGGGTPRWQAIAALRSGNEPADHTLRHFLADVQTRHLVAEFVRRRHHLRAMEVIAEHHAALAAFDFGDAILRRFIANVCAAHGLKPHELEDTERYPDRCDIRGEAANVRFAAIVLRLGDLLDMSQDRACPLLLNAACPLPADSLAHWSQYQAIKLRLTAPDQIGIHAECQNQDQHRVLSDWCQWLTREVTEARTIMARCKRHGQWQLPACRMEEPGATIVIRPADDATYVPLDWTFDFDQDEVVRRLVYDVYESPYSFIRELVQNALDATRCQLYADLAAAELEVPDSPTKLAADKRSAYPIRVGLHEVQVDNSLSGEAELRQVVTVEDQGIGMDREIIRRYFLQIGRSFYATDEFRRSFRFVPSSRFGVGFLSVFAVSDQVVVDTFKPSSPAGDGPIRLTLTGPRNYLLVEHGLRAAGGTRIEVVLRERMEPGMLARLVGEWCRRVEFPIVVDDLGSEITIEAEGPADFVYEIPDVSEEGATFSVRALPVSGGSVEGEVYIFARNDSRGESWVARHWAEYEYPLAHPRATVPPFPSSLMCLNGIAVGLSFGRESDAYSVRLDYRGETAVTVSRGRFRAVEGPWNKAEGPVNAVLEQALKDHLASAPRAQGPEGWQYRQRLIGQFGRLAGFWRTCPETVPLIDSGCRSLASLEEVERAEAIMVVVDYGGDLAGEGLDGQQLERAVAALPGDGDVVVMLGGDVERLCDEHRAAIFRGRSVSSMTTAGRLLLLEWRASDGWDYLAGEKDRQPISLAVFPDQGIIGMAVHKTTDGIYSHCLLNSANGFVQWVLKVRDASRKREFGLTERQFSQILSLLKNVASYSGYELPRLSAYVDAWRSLPDLPGELYPPKGELDRGMFGARWITPEEEVVELVAGTIKRRPRRKGKAK